MAARPVKIASLPGIKRDGTKYEGDFYVDGQWCRFQRKLPRKMGGYKQLSNSVSGIATGIYSWSNNNVLYLHIGSANYLEQITVGMNNFATSQTYDRTPLTFTKDGNNIWSMDAIYDPITASAALIAHASPSLADISSDAAFPIYGGSINSTDRLIPVGGTSPSVSGGVLVMHPYLTAYGSDGYFAWSAPDDLTDWTVANGGGDAYVTAQKIVFGMVTRGGAANSPSALLWSLDSLLRVSYIGGDATWSFDTLTDESSILSQQCVVEYNGVYYWAGVDQFLMFNGVVREVPNDMNLNWFYDNLNFNQRQKVYAVKVPRWGEIWWCFPFGDATECTHAVIFNVREQTWYDTILPNYGRSNGQYAKVFQYPVMTGTTSINSILELGTLIPGSGYTDATYYQVPLIYTPPNAIATLGSITGGSGYLGTGSYLAVALTGGSGTGATANITVAGGAVTVVTLVNPGSGYLVADTLSVANANVGGSGAGFSIPVAAVTTVSAYIGGSEATANIVVVGGAVTSVTLVSTGLNYQVGDILTVASTALGGGGLGFKITVNALTGYSLWMHENGLDENTGTLLNAIESYFETSDISLPAAGESQNKSLRVVMIEPDFVQKGEMSVEVTGRANARSPEVSTDPQYFPEVTDGMPVQDQVVYFKTIRRQMRFKFASNEVGGDYQLGQTLAHIEPADGTVLG